MGGKKALRAVAAWPREARWEAKRACLERPAWVMRFRTSASLAGHVEAKVSY
jgi:hypothetical protein